MSHNNGIISKPIDVIDDVAYILGESTGDVGALCSSGGINPYAKYKPMDIDSVQVPTEAQRKAINYGITPPAASSTPADTKNTAWTYTKPKKWARLLDFDGYNHNAVSPIVAAGNVTVSQADSIGVSLATFRNVVGSMTLNDFGDLSGYYLAVMMIGSSNSLPYIKTASQPFGTAVAPVLTLTYSELIPFNNGTEYYLCLCDKAQTTLGQLPAGAKYLPIPRFSGQDVSDFIGKITKQTGYDVAFTFDTIISGNTAPTSANFTQPAPSAPNYFSPLPSPDPNGNIENELQYYLSTGTNTSLKVRFKITKMSDTIYAQYLYANLSPTYCGSPTARQKVRIYEQQSNGAVVEKVTGALSLNTTYFATLYDSALVLSSSNSVGVLPPSSSQTKLRPTLTLYDGAGESSVKITSVSFGIRNY